MRGLGIVLGLLLAASGADAATIFLTSCAQATVLAAINAATDGDTIELPVCTTAWPTTQTWNLNNKMLWVRGQGPTRTIIQHTGTGVPQLVLINNVNRPFRLSNIGWTNNGGGALEPLFTIQGAIPNPSSHVLIDNIETTGLPTTNGPLLLISNVLGVMARNHITLPEGLGTNFAARLALGSFFGGENGDASTARPDHFGQALAFFLEDNVSERVGDFGTGLVDHEEAARAVLRYNSLSNQEAKIGAHGTETSGRNRGTRTGEVYKNTMHFPFGNNNCSEARGDTGLYWDNLCDGLTSGPHIPMTANRRNGATGEWMSCDGYNPMDLNVAEHATNPNVRNVSAVYASGTATAGSATDDLVDAEPNGLEAGTSEDGTSNGVFGGTGGWFPYNIINWGAGLSYTYTSNPTTDTFTVAGGSHALTNGMRIRFMAANQPSVTGGTEYSVWYYVLNANQGAGTFQLDKPALGGGPGGGLANITGVGTGTVRTWNWSGVVLSNTATTLETRYTKGPTHTWVPGDNYEITKPVQCFDTLGMGQTDLLTTSTGPIEPSSWIHAEFSPIYVWDNDSTGGSPPVTWNSFLFNHSFVKIDEGPPPGPPVYTPYIYRCPGGTLAVNDPSNTDCTDRGQQAVCTYKHGCGHPLRWDNSVLHVRSRTPVTLVAVPDASRTAVTTANRPSSE